MITDCCEGLSLAALANSRNNCSNDDESTEKSSTQSYLLFNSFITSYIFLQDVLSGAT